jgi:organic radical activating enzyme
MSGLVSISESGTPAPAACPPGPIPGPDPAPYRLAEIYLFDTCTHKCGYCWLAESGQVLDMDQLKPFRDPAFIERFTRFFLDRTSAGSRWLIQVTGGEPLLAPNLDRMVEPLLDAGNRLCVYTALLLGSNHPGLRFLLRRAPDVEYVMASFHPEAENDEKSYFDRIRMLKDAGHRVFLRLVGHPARLHRLDELSDRCRELDICFFPTTLMSNRYPGAYTGDEAAKLRSHFSSISQHVQLLGGLDTTDLRCYGGSRVISVNMQTGVITPCITVKSPVLGNLFENRLELNTAPILCPEPGINCVCDLHYQQNVLPAAPDRDNFERQLRGFTPPADLSARLDGIAAHGVHFYRNATIGMGNVDDDSRLFYSADEIRRRYRQRRELPMPAPQVALEAVPGAVLPDGPIPGGIPARIATSPAAWSYAAVIPLAIPQAGAKYWVRVRASVLRGKVGFGLLTRDGSAFQDRCFIPAGTDLGPSYLEVKDPGDVQALVIENASADGASELDLDEVTVLTGAR